MNSEWAARERIKVVADATSYLVDFAQTFALLPYEYRPTATKYAVNHLVVLALADPVRAEIFTRDVAVAADVSRATLRKQIQDRCWLFQNLNRLMGDRRTRQQAEAQLMEIITQ